MGIYYYGILFCTVSILRDFIKQWTFILTTYYLNKLKHI